MEGAHAFMRLSKAQQQRLTRRRLPPIATILSLYLFQGGANKINSTNCIKELRGEGSAGGPARRAPGASHQGRRRAPREGLAGAAKRRPKIVEPTPARPGNIYNLACAEARNGHVEASARLLTELLDRGIDYGIREDADLASARAQAAFEPVLRRVAELSKPEGGSAVAFRLAEKDLLTEGIAYDSATRSFFVSSVHRRKIVRRSADGKVSDFVAEGQDGLEAVLALAVDAKRRVLWACSAAMPQMRGYEAALEDSTALFSFDLRTARVLRKIALPRGRQVMSSAIWRSQHHVYDMPRGGIYVARPGNPKFEEVCPPGVFRSPQGIVSMGTARLTSATGAYALLCRGSLPARA